jgi:hypothetical protein
MNGSFKMYDDPSDTCRILDMFSVLTTLKQKLMHTIVYIPTHTKHLLIVLCSLNIAGRYSFISFSFFP